jgi:RHS repeat-associated protein
MTVTEPGGRYLLFTYSSSTGLLSKVEAFDGVQGHPRTDWVNYTYTQIGGGGSAPDQWCLTGVTYSDGTFATYTYESDNVPDQPTRGSFKFWPLLSTANDVRYHGPMRRIAYDYQDQGPHGAITAERYSASDGNKGLPVSSIPGNLPPPLTGGHDFYFPIDFTETRGDGPSRAFHYSALHMERHDNIQCPDIIGTAPSQFLLNYSDFQGHTTWLHYNPNWYVDRVTDARGTNDGDPNHSTSYARGSPPPSGIGEILSVTYPNSTGTIQYAYESPPQYPVYDPHYVTSITTPRGASPAAKTIHTRDSNHRITQTDHMEGNTLLARETFSYCDQVDSQCSNNPLGQIKTQKLKNGAYVHYRYDSRGLLIDKWEPTWNDTALETDPKTHYTYYPDGDNTKIPWTDRVKTMTLPPNYPYGYQASETYEYDKNGVTPVAGRGLVTKIAHADHKYRSFGYDAYGNKLWEENELRKRTSYTYDSYNRVLTIKDPIGQTTGRTTTFTYTPTNGGGGSPYKHTTNSPDTVTTPAVIVTTNVYDENFRKTQTSVDGKTTWFHYDNVGNQDYVTDPRGTSSPGNYTTYTDYDSRNRKWQVREPLGRTTWFEYGDNINITKIHRPDGTVEDKSYDGMNRLSTDTVPKAQGVSIVTQFQYYPYNVHSGALLWKVIDGESHTTTFEYDPSGLKTKMTYHDQSTQQWAYDAAHNLQSRTTVAGEIQNFGYDNRNRKIGEWWDGWPADAEWRAFGYDDASRLTLATNGLGTYWTNFIADVRRFYDDADRLTLDRQTVYVNGVPNTKDVDYPTYDDDGKLLRMYVYGVSPAYDYTFGYDDMGRFKTIKPTGGSSLFQYSYDAASNETQRYNWANHIAQNYVPDNLNRMMSVEVRNTNTNTQLGLETYGYDSASRLHTVTREDNKQDSFTYYLDGELNLATYGAAPTPPPTPTPPPSSPTPTPTPPVGQVAEPTFAPPGGNIYPNTTVRVQISTTTSGAQIRYTLDEGKSWTTIANGGYTIYFQPGVVGKTLTAIAFKSGMMDSNPHSEDYWYDSGRAGAATYPLDMAGIQPGPGPMAPDVSTVTYTLDKAGNRTSVNGTSYSPNSINQYTSVGGNPVTNGNEHEIQVYGGFTYYHMRDQELTKVTATGFTYELAYDALGRCVRRTINNNPAYTTYYIYDGDKPILEYNANNGLVGFNLYGKEIDEIIKRGANGADNQWHWYFLQQDHEGSVTHLTDSSGAIIERYRYDAFGAPTIYAPNWTVRTGSSYGNRFLFTGREYDGAWVYEYRARVYHSGLGRFMSEDPKLFDAGDYNLFRYCHNDPLDLTDPMGLDPYTGAQAIWAAVSWERAQAQLQAREDALGWPGHGAIEIGRLNYAIDKMSQQMTKAITGAAREFASRFLGGRDRSGHPNATNVGDKEIYGELGKIFDKVSAANVPAMTRARFLNFQNKNNTEAFYNARWYHYEGELGLFSGKDWFGHEINNMAVGEGFAARGWSTGAMNDLILGRRYSMMSWNAMHGRDPGGIMGGEIPWALVGYSYYQIRSSGDY